jgi:casein kinase 1
MPTLWASGLWGRWDYLAMDLLGNSLDRLYRKSGKNVMDLRSACSIAIQLVRPPPLCTQQRLLIMEWGG